MASEIHVRKYEDLREEERIIVYRNLIGALMRDTLSGLPPGRDTDKIRHTLSELLNSIFGHRQNALFRGTRMVEQCNPPSLLRISRKVTGRFA